MNVDKNAGDFVSTVENKRAQISLGNISQDGQFTGYASLFDVADLANDIVEFDAFSTTLELHSLRPVRMLFQHDPDQVIGLWLTLSEDKKVLYFEGQLSLDVSRAKDVHALDTKLAAKIKHAATRLSLS